jgi:hypothetical protein
MQQTSEEFNRIGAMSSSIEELSKENLQSQHLLMEGQHNISAAQQELASAQSEVLMQLSNLKEQQVSYELIQ